MDKKKAKSGSAGNLMDIFHRTSKTQRSPPAGTSSSYTSINIVKDIPSAGGDLNSPEADKNIMLSITNLDQAADYIEDMQSKLAAAKVQLATAPKEDLIMNLQSELAAVKAELATALKENSVKSVQNELAAAETELAALRKEMEMSKTPRLPLENRYSPLDSSEEEELVEKETAWLFPTTTTSNTVTEAEQTRKKRRRTHTKTPPTTNIKSAVRKRQEKTKVPLPSLINVSTILSKSVKNRKRIII